jgi:DNA-binding beta-propeller fold protein YncE
VASLISVSVIDLTSNTVTTTIPVRTDPIWTTTPPDGRHAYVLNYDSNNMSVLTIDSQ